VSVETELARLAALVGQLQGALGSTDAITDLQAATAATYDTAITAGTGWTSSATYSKIGRLIVLQGSFSKTSGTPASNDVMGTLPAEARPATELECPAATQNNNVVGMIRVQTDGDIVWRAGSTTETDKTSIDGIAFTVAA
jgi:hypothetical protein